ncbi:MAG: pyridoxal-dependent decarboxylase [Kiloniellales bacterium]|nr:pyridoxal-dependent decarboxylase [Kiloniellales bacterium]
MSESEILQRAAAHALDYLEGLDHRPVGATADAETLRARLGGPLPETGAPATQVIDDLVRDVEGGILDSTGGRFFGWVIGGSHPAALAADWLAAAWDQNAAAFACSPAAAVVEEVCGAWLKELLGLPADASFGFVTGCQGAHATALAAARNRLLRERGWDVERRGLAGAPPLRGLAGAPPLRVLTSANRHESLLRAVRLLGFGSDALEIVPSDDGGRIGLGELETALETEPERPVILVLQAGDLNCGVFDPFGPACALAKAAGAWVHVDGAFGLWAATSPRFRHLLEGVAEADSWATDGHKWLNLPFDSGFVFVADPEAHRAAFTQTASYSQPVEGARNQKDWNPEWSRRARGFPAYAAIRALGRAGIAGIVERCCDHAARLVGEIGALPGVEILARPVINQGLLRFLDEAGDHDRRTDAVIVRLQAEGTAWFGGTTWNGKRAMRVSVCNWRTTEDDVTRTVAAVKRVLAEGL